MGDSRPRAGVVGPWKRADIHSLNKLCNDASYLVAYLKEPRHGSLLDLLPPKSGFRDISEVQKRLHAHPIYRWLQRQDPPVLREMPHYDPVAEFRFVQLLLRFMIFAFAESNQIVVPPKKRTDKARTTAWDVFNRAEQYLVDGAVLMAHPARRASLIELLVEAKSELMRPHQRAPRTGEETYPILETLADHLYKDFGLADVPLIRAVAKAVGSGCSPKTATRYVQRAKRSMIVPPP
jgi:hypothetical protein